MPSSLAVAWIAVLLHVCRLRCLLQNNSTMRPSPPTHPSSQPSPQHPQPPPPPHSQMMSTQVSLIQHTLSLMKNHLFRCVIAPCHGIEEIHNYVMFFMIAVNCFYDMCLWYMCDILGNVSRKIYRIDFIFVKCPLCDKRFTFVNFGECF